MRWEEKVEKNGEVVLLYFDWRMGKLDAGEVKTEPVLIERSGMRLCGEKEEARCSVLKMRSNAWHGWRRTRNALLM